MRALAKCVAVLLLGAGIVTSACSIQRRTAVKPPSPASGAGSGEAGGGGPGGGSAKAGATLLGQLPASFAGILPCADCTGVHHRLDLFSDGVFYLRRAYLGRSNETLDDIGKWEAASGGAVLVLHGTHEPSPSFAILASDRLRILDTQGRPIESTLNQELRREEGLAGIAPRLAMRGMYVTAGAAGRFTECTTQRMWPVADQADNAALVEAYEQSIVSRGAPRLVEVVGRIATRHGAAGEGPESYLIVEQFVRLAPGESCGTPQSVPVRDTEPAPVTGALQGTRWKLTHLGATEIAAPTGEREPHLVLDPGNPTRFAGTGGCNRLSGAYTLDGEKLTFGRVTMTRMACAEGMANEARLVKALEGTQAWRIDGPQLELLDARGEVVARFEARLD